MLIGEVYSPGQVNAVIAAASIMSGFEIPDHVSGIDSPFDDSVSHAMLEIGRGALNDPKVIMNDYDPFGSQIKTMEAVTLVTNNVVEQSGLAVLGTLAWEAFKELVKRIGVATVFRWLVRILGSYGFAQTVTQFLSEPDQVAVYKQVGTSAGKLITVVSAKAASELAEGAKRAINEQYRFKKAGRKPLFYMPD